MADEEKGTSTEETTEEEAPAEAAEETTEEPTEEGTSEEKTELESYKETLKESGEILKRYKQQVTGTQKGMEELSKRVAAVEEGKKPLVKEESQSELTPEDQTSLKYLKKLGMFTKVDFDKAVQAQIAPFKATADARAKGEQKTILEKFIKGKPDLGSKEDSDGTRMKQVIAKLGRITPMDPFNPNVSLEEDLELAYNWVFGKESNQEALTKAKAAGRGEGHEAAETKVGAGASTAATSSKKKQRSPQSEALLKEWGVDDETINKKEK